MVAVANIRGGGVMAEYDGWTLKTLSESGGKLSLSFCHNIRKEVIEHIEKIIPESWAEYRLKGTHKIVKVKLIEME